MLKIGIIGSGAIGSSLARVISKDFKKEAKLVALYDLDKAKSSRLALKLNKKVADNLDQLIRLSDLVIEAASAKCSWAVAKKCLKSRRDVMVMSVGGLISHLKELISLAVKFKAKVYIPSGAIAGIDALKAAKMGKIQKVVLTTRKNPRGFIGVKFVEDKGIELGRIKKDTILYFGPAERAVKLFPQNINVAAVLSLAGLGPKRTLVKIIASPKLKNNIHEIEIVSKAGNIFTRTENVLHPDNPKTSFLAVLAAVAKLKQILVPVEIGT